MKQLSKLIGLLSLLVILLAPFAYFFDFMSFGAMVTVMLMTTIGWYGTAFFWIGQQESPTLEDDPLL